MKNDEKWWSTPSPNNICHYTTAVAALSILSQGRLRLGPFRHSNDPYEFEFWQPSGLWGEEPQESGLTTGTALIALQGRVNRVAFGMDDGPAPANYRGHDVSHRGFGSLPMWAHYGDRFRGACLVFDSKKLVRAVDDQLESSSDGIFHHAVRYCEDPLYLPGIGIDDDPTAYVKKHESDVLFRKRQQWSYEGEFRIVTISKTECPQSVKYGDALIGVITGSKSLLGYGRLRKVFGIREQTQRFSNGLQTID